MFWIVQYQQKSGRVTHKNFTDETAVKAFCDRLTKNGQWFNCTMWLDLG